MTLKEQYIYNCYLETSRKVNLQPFRYRKDFEGFEEKEEYVYIAKLGYFFNKFPNINIKDFFEAPFYVYNEKYFDLRFFTTQKAIKTYTIYENKFLPNNPDQEQTLQKIKDSFLFIYNYCKSKDATLTSYTSLQTPDNKFHDFMLHLKNRDTIVYALFVFPGFDKIINTYEKEIKEFVFGDTLKDLNFYRTKYFCSVKAKKLSILIFDKLNSKQITV